MRALTRSGEQPDGGGLSGAVDTQQGEQLSPADLQIQVVHGGDGFVPLDKAACLDGLHGLFLLLGFTAMIADSRGEMWDFACSVIPAG